MSDRELLDFAAKAAGVAAHPTVQDMHGWGEVRYGLSEAVFNEETKEYWNPLTDDGDALRLAATCHMVLDWSGSELHVRFWLTQSPEAPTLTFKSSDCGGDKATIVRAAAEIGRAMP